MPLKLTFTITNFSNTLLLNIKVVVCPSVNEWKLNLKIYSNFHAIILNLWPTIVCLSDEDLILLKLTFTILPISIKTLLYRHVNCQARVVFIIKSIFCHTAVMVDRKPSSQDSKDISEEERKKQFFARIMENEPSTTKSKKG